MSLAIVNGRVIDPASGLSAVMDILVEGRVIARLGKGLEGDETIDAAGCVVCPGLVDIHVHLREPGFESKETIASGSRAAARGGFTSVVPMPNTAPPIDNADMLEFVRRRACEAACIGIWPAACATQKREGIEVTDMARLKAAGAVAVTDDGADVASSELMRQVLECASACALTCLAHCEDTSLKQGAASPGIQGMSKAMEESAIERNVRLAAMTGARLHVQHITTADGIGMVRRAKAHGVNVTCETAPHYFTLTDRAVAEHGANAKMNPPLREAQDVAAVKEGLADGTIDCIATDHAPHTQAEKDVEFQLAPCGIIGLETSLALTLTELVEPGAIALERAIELMTLAPARILGLPVGRLEPGGPADITVFDPKAEWTVDPKAFVSMGRNTPFAGRTVRGLVETTIHGGRVVYLRNRG